MKQQQHKSKPIKTRPPSLFGTGSMLPIGHFDDDAFELRPPEEWIRLGSSSSGGTSSSTSSSTGTVGGTGTDPVRCRLPAVALCATQYPKRQQDTTFEDVTVTGYDAQAMSFTVERSKPPPPPATEEERKRADKAGLLFGETAQLGRLFVCFLAEDPLRFAARVATAHFARYKASTYSRGRLAR